MHDSNLDQSRFGNLRDHVAFYLNGKRFVIDGETASLSLAEWLRQHQSKVGTKIVCNEGDCGACSVLLGKVNTSGSKIEYRAIDSCIAFLFQLDGTHVVTVEGLSVDGMLSPVQDAMVSCHGSQCGFCTPGFVTTMHGMVEASQPLNDSTLRYGLSGNLCRCTGYLQILQAGKSIDVDGVAKLSEFYPDEPMLNDFATCHDRPVMITTETAKTFVPSTVEQAAMFLAERPNATIVSGATDYGVLHNHGRTKPNDLLCLRGIKTLRKIVVEDGVMVIGALATWMEIEKAVKSILPEYHKILIRFGSPQIREMGTIGGNIASGSPIADAVPLHLVLDSEIELYNIRGTRRVAMRDFYLGYRKTAIQPGELITAIHTPLLKSDERLKLYKISKRCDMDISTMTFAMLAKLDGDIIRDAKIVVGGVGPMVARIEKAEASLIGRPWCEESFRLAGRIAKDEVAPWTDVRGSAAYRSSLTENLLVKSFYDSTE